MTTSAQPDPERARAMYRVHAASYDASARRTMPMRRRTIAGLGLQPGQTVLDVACGTGLSFALLRDAVGPSGRVIGVEVSPEMLAFARARCQQMGWANVTLVEGAAESAPLPGPLDAILFNFTHDVLQSPQALARIVQAARPGARVAASGLKYPPWWLAPLRPWVRALAHPYMTTLDGLDCPWRHLLPHVEGWRWRPALGALGYVACGTVKGATALNRPSAR
jgi:demethylmenaquinone methyltransferase/2-methoxy-6-polyprenyl-1,4-benzoquinol methylase